MAGLFDFDSRATPFFCESCKTRPILISERGVQRFTYVSVCEPLNNMVYNTRSVLLGNSYSCIFKIYGSPPEAKDI